MFLLHCALNYLMSKLPKIKKMLDTSYFMYKVCEGCDDILYYDTPVCPTCKSYRFNDTKKAVLKAYKQILKEFEQH